MLHSVNYKLVHNRYKTGSILEFENAQLNWYKNTTIISHKLQDIRTLFTYTQLMILVSPHHTCCLCIHRNTKDRRYVMNHHVKQLYYNGSWQLTKTFITSNMRYGICLLTQKSINPTTTYTFIMHNGYPHPEIWFL